MSMAMKLGSEHSDVTATVKIDVTLPSLPDSLLLLDTAPLRTLLEGMQGAFVDLSVRVEKQEAALKSERLRQDEARAALAKRVAQLERTWEGVRTRSEHVETSVQQATSSALNAQRTVQSLSDKFPAFKEEIRQILEAFEKSEDDRIEKRISHREGMLQQTRQELCEESSRAHDLMIDALRGDTVKLEQRIQKVISEFSEGLGSDVARLKQQCSSMSSEFRDGISGCWAGQRNLDESFGNIRDENRSLRHELWHALASMQQGHQDLDANEHNSTNARVDEVASQFSGQLKDILRRLTACEEYRFNLTVADAAGTSTCVSCYRARSPSRVRSPSPVRGNDSKVQPRNEHNSSPPPAEAAARQPERPSSAPGYRGTARSGGVAMNGLPLARLVGRTDAPSIPTAAKGATFLPANAMGPYDLHQQEIRQSQSRHCSRGVGRPATARSCTVR